MHAAPATPPALPCPLAVLDLVIGQEVALETVSQSRQFPCWGLAKRGQFPLTTDNFEGEADQGGKCWQPCQSSPVASHLSSCQEPQGPSLHGPAPQQARFWPSKLHTFSSLLLRLLSVLTCPCLMSYHSLPPAACSAPSLLHPCRKWQWQCRWSSPCCRLQVLWRL